MNKSELVADVAGRSGLDPIVVADVVNTAVAVITGAVAAGDKVVIQGFGTFLRRARARRVARDIGGGRALVVPATHVPVFRAGKAFREAVVSRRRRRPTARSGGKAAAARPSVASARPNGARGRRVALDQRRVRPGS